MKWKLESSGFAYVLLQGCSGLFMAKWEIKSTLMILQNLKYKGSHKGWLKEKVYYLSYSLQENWNSLSVQAGPTLQREVCANQNNGQRTCLPAEYLLQQKLILPMKVWLFSLFNDHITFNELENTLPLKISLGLNKSENITL